MLCLWGPHLNAENAELSSLSPPPSLSPTPQPQVIELQELVDTQLVAAGQGASPLRKAWRRRCLAQIGMCMQDRFAPLLQRCSQLIAAGERTDQRLAEILEEADEFVGQASAACAAAVAVNGLLAAAARRLAPPHAHSHQPLPPTAAACPAAAPQLAPIYDRVAPCFPPSYRIFGVVRPAPAAPLRPLRLLRLA